MHPVLYQYGDVTVRSYGLLLVLSFVVGLALALSRAPLYHVARRHVVRLFALIVMAALVGSRILFVAEHAAPYVADPTRVLMVSDGGLSMYGGALLAALVSLIYTRVSRVSFLDVAALLAAPLALGEAITRVGCFLNGCCFGTHCDLAWAVVFPAGTVAGHVFPGAPIHPTQLYAALSSFLIFVVLLRSERTHASAGKIFGIFLLLHGSVRLAIEQLRYHAPSVLRITIADTTLTSAELVALGLVVVGCGMLLHQRTAGFHVYTGGVTWAQK